MSWLRRAHRLPKRWAIIAFRARFTLVPGRKDEVVMLRIGETIVHAKFVLVNSVCADIIEIYYSFAPPYCHQADCGLH